MVEQATTPAPQEKTPFQKAFEIINNIQEFHDLEPRFRVENVEGSAKIFLEKKLWGRAGNQFVFLAAHIALQNANSKETPAKFVECLKKAKENYEKYLPQVIEKYKPPYQKKLDGINFLIANPDVAFRAEVDVLTKRGRLKPAAGLNVI